MYCIFLFIVFVVLGFDFRHGICPFDFILFTHVFLASHSPIFLVHFLKDLLCKGPHLVCY